MINLINNIDWCKEWKDTYIYERGIIISTFTIIATLLTLIFVPLCLN